MSATPYYALQDRHTKAARSAPAGAVARLQRRPEEALQRLDDVCEVGGCQDPCLDVRLGGRDGVAPPRVVLPAAVRPRHVPADGDVTAASAKGAKRTALYAERVTGNRARGLRVLSAERLWAVGWRTQRTLFEEGPTDERT
jgi:hypothetical protein